MIHDAGCMVELFWFSFCLCLCLASCIIHLASCILPRTSCVFYLLFCRL